MYKITNFIFFIFVILFFVSIFKFYFSNKNIQLINANRLNSKNIIKSKTLDIPILENDTQNIIEFNSSFSEEIKNDKPRNFWNLFKTK